MTVYIDVLFALNLIVNYFILLASAKLASASTRFLRLLAGALLGAFYSLSIFLPELNPFLDACIKVFFSASIVFVTFGFHKFKRFLRLTVTFHLVSFAYAGIMLAVWFIFKPDGMAVHNSVVYFNISPLILIATTVISYCVLSIIRRFSKNHLQNQSFYQVEILLENVVVTGNALLDTGNTLIDLFSGAPVVVAEFNLIKDLLPIATRDAFKSGNKADVPEPMQERFRLIPYSAIGGKGLLPAFRADGVTVRSKGKVYHCKNAVIAVSEQAIGDTYKMLIGREILNQGEGVLHNEDIKASKI